MLGFFPSTGMRGGRGDIIVVSFMGMRLGDGVVGMGEKDEEWERERGALRILVWMVGLLV